MLGFAIIRRVILLRLMLTIKLVLELLFKETAGKKSIRLLQVSKLGNIKCEC